MLKKKITILKQSTYFYLEMDKCEVDVQNELDGNDANSIAWINVNCLIDLIHDKKIKITYHCKIAFKFFLNINM